VTEATPPRLPGWTSALRFAPEPGPDALELLPGNVVPEQALLQDLDEALERHGPR
jgi:hypothetical protein